MQELTEKLHTEIHRVRDLVKPEWEKGNKTTSVLMECNIDRAEDAIKAGDVKRMKKSLSIMEEYPLKLILVLCLLTLSLVTSAQLIPSVGVAVDKEGLFPTYNFELIRGEENFGFSTNTGFSGPDVDIHMLVGAYFLTGKRTFFDARAGFFGTAPTLNLGFKYMPVSPLVISADLLIKERPAAGIKVGFLIGDIHYKGRR